ncbi:MAG TPA: glycosyltransferase family 4 protein [Vicinamibacterales bacterium]|nr:glycosyltransferase family 4 protein [Vicinamibacterales bacterium]
MPARVLAITSELPWPLNTGGHIRSFHLLRAVARRFDLRVIAGVETADDPGLAVMREHGITVLPAVTGPRRPMDEAVRAARATLGGEPYVMFHRHNRAAMRDQIRQAIAGAAPDLVYLDHLDPYAFRPLFPQARILVDFHNLYGRLAGRVATERAGVAGRYLAREARLLSRMEARAAKDASAVMAVSADEAEEFRQLGAARVALVPNGVDCAAYAHLPVGRTPTPPVLVYIGALSWVPNAVASDYLARVVLPEVRRVHPDAVLKLVGRDPGLAVRALADLPGVEVHGNVPDVTVYLAEASLLAVALDSGGGTRLKILEAFAAGLPVVSTPVGCEGIEAVHGEHLWVAEYEAFAAGVNTVLADPAGAAARADKARDLAMRHYDWAALGEQACAAIAAAARG